MTLLISGSLAQIRRTCKSRARSRQGYAAECERTLPGPGGIIARVMDATSVRTAAWSRYAGALLLIACVCVAFVAALRLKQDTNWDLQNYHYYDPWAWLAGRILDWDIAAAQLQTFHNPLPDVPFYLLVAAGADPRAITLWLALPTGIAAYCGIRIAWLLFADLAIVHRIGATAAAVAIGFTGAMGIAQLGSTTDEWLVTAFTMAALWLLLVQERAASAASNIAPAPLLAGLLMGIASGLKLTAATYAVGLCAALLLLGRSPGIAIRKTAWFAAGMTAGLAIALGPWSYQLWTRFRHPLFPYGNQWIRSPWWDAQPVLPNRLGTQSMSDWLTFPFKLLAPPPGFVSELPYVDARLPALAALALVAAGGFAIARLARDDVRRPPQFVTTASLWRFAGVFFAASFLVWALVHSILRYTIPLEIMSGVLIVGLLGYLLRPRHAIVAATLAVAALASTTQSADWGRTAFGPAWFDVRVPPVERNALVLLVVDAPMSYVLPFFPPDARHVGIRNNVNGPERRNRLAERVRNVVREHRGPLYALSFPAGQGESDLLAHGLRRVLGGCAEIRTNMPTSPIELCRLERMDAAAK